MTEKELERSKVIHMANEKRLTQTKGAQRLKISERHFRRLLRRYREKGDAGVVSGHRGEPSNNRMGEEKRQIILDLMLTTYQGFGPTLASEKLAERDRIQVSKETLRQILMEEGLHRAKTKKKGTAHPLRERRACRGELVQMDGSYHAWLEENLAEGFTVFDFPIEHCRSIRTTNSLERVNREIRRRTRVVGVFPNEASCLRLISALLMEISEEWQIGKWYCISKLLNC